MPETNLVPGARPKRRPARYYAMSKAPAASRKKDPVKAVAGRHNAGPRTLKALNAIIAASKAFVEGGTRAVLGEGPLHAEIAFVGEQPGDQDVTNAVKHFKYVERGKRRLHQKPTAGEVRHYRWWLERELDLVKPKLVVALGATAVLALTGKALPITRVRGKAEFDGHPGYITVHPSYLLRIPDAAAKREAYAAFVADLKNARKLATSLGAV
jgi:uracil-DNA glycosylase